MKQVIAMTVKGKKDLTRECLKTMSATVGRDTEIELVIVDATPARDSCIMHSDLSQWLTDNFLSDISYYPGLGISASWNECFDMLDAEKPTMVWVVNNDVIFKRAGWLDLMIDRLADPSMAMVGAYSMSVFGHGFVTGGVWGFKLQDALSIVDANGNILDESMNSSMQDVDLSVRFEKAGRGITHVPGIEYGDEPYVVHAISQTQLAEHGTMNKLYEIRAQERRFFIDKHGRKDGLELYAGVLES